MTVKNDLDAGVKNFTPDAAPRTKTGLDGITVLLAWAGLAILSEPDICPDRLRTYTGGTLPDRQRRP